MKVYRADTLRESQYREMVSLLANGAVIAIPTDTAYGLAADPFNKEAVARIFEIKGREETKPILLIVDSVVMAESVSKPNSLFQGIAREFWPGPLTLIVPAAAGLSAAITAGSNTVGLRWPDTRVATTLAGLLGRPITATSANRSGMPAAITADEVITQLGGSIDALIDGGELTVRGGSTVLDLTTEPPVLLREGPVSFDRLHAFLDGRIRKYVA